VIFGALQVTKVLSTADVKRAIAGSGKDFGKSIDVHECGEFLVFKIGVLYKQCDFMSLLTAH
jgi:hypothetical protein